MEKTYGKKTYRACCSILFAGSANRLLMHRLHLQRRRVDGVAIMCPVHSQSTQPHSTAGQYRERRQISQKEEMMREPVVLVLAHRPAPQVSSGKPLYDS